MLENVSGFCSKDPCCHFLYPDFLFAVAMTATPGPGNLTMLAVGRTTKLKKCDAFLNGQVAGRQPLDIPVAFGLGGIDILSEKLRD